MLIGGSPFILTCPSRTMLGRTIAISSVFHLRPDLKRGIPRLLTGLDPPEKGVLAPLQALQNPAPDINVQVPPEGIIAPNISEFL